MPTLTHPALVAEHCGLDTYTTRLRTLTGTEILPHLIAQLPVSSSVDSALVYFSAPVVAPVLKSLEPAKHVLQEPDPANARTILYIEKHDTDTINFVLYPDDLQCLVRSSSAFKNITLTEKRNWPSVQSLASTPLVPITYDTKINSTKASHSAYRTSLNYSFRQRAQLHIRNEQERLDGAGAFELAQERERFRFMPMEQRENAYLYDLMVQAKMPAVLMDDLVPVPSQAEIKRFQFPLPPEDRPHRPGQSAAKVARIVNVLADNCRITPSQPLGKVDPAQSGVMVPDRLVQTMALMPAGVLSIELDSQSPDYTVDDTRISQELADDIRVFGACWRVVLTIGRDTRYVLPVATTYLTPNPIVVQFNYRCRPSMDAEGNLDFPVPTSISLNTTLLKKQGVMHAERLAEALGQYPMRHINRTAGPSPCGVRKAAGEREFIRALQTVFAVRVGGLAQQIILQNKLPKVMREIATGETSLRQRNEISQAMYRVMAHYFREGEDTHSRIVKRLPQAVAGAYVEFIRAPGYDMGSSGFGIAYDMFVIQLMRNENIRVMYINGDLRRALDSPDLYKKQQEKMEPGIRAALERTTSLLLPHAPDLEENYLAPKLDGIDPLGIPDNVRESKLEQHHRRVRALIGPVRGLLAETEVSDD